jgi:hypothetical protein
VDVLAEQSIQTVERQSEKHKFRNLVFDLEEAMAELKEFVGMAAARHTNPLFAGSRDL